MNLTDAQVLVAPAGWMNGLDRPPHQGSYERLSMLGVVVDRWDGERWRRIGQHASVICANQDLPWRLRFTNSQA